MKYSHECCISKATWNEFSQIACKLHHLAKKMQNFEICNEAKNVKLAKYYHCKNKPVYGTSIKLMEI